MRTTSGESRAKTRFLGSWVPITTTTQDGNDDGALDDQGQARRLVGQRPTFADTERVQCHQNHRLDGDTPEDVADRDVELAAGCGAVGDRDLRQVRGHREQNQSAQRLTEMKTVGQDVGVVR